MNKEEIEERIKYAKSDFTDGIEILLEIIIKLEQENNKQNKIIDEMANSFFELYQKIPGTMYKFFENGKPCEYGYDKENNECKEINCKSCIKQYFEKKVEVENNMNNNKMIKSGEHYTQGNADDLGKALEGLGQFCHNWCMNCKETEEKAEPIFRCNGCDFKNDNGNCRIKIFLSNKSSDNPERYTCME